MCVQAVRRGAALHHPPRLAGDTPPPSHPTAVPSLACAEAMTRQEHGAIPAPAGTQAHHTTAADPGRLPRPARVRTAPTDEAHEAPGEGPVAHAPRARVPGRPPLCQGAAARAQAPRAMTRHGGHE